MSKAAINYVGGIDDVQKGTNLTGSQTLFSLDIGKSINPKIIIDSGAIQGVKGANKLNQEIRQDIISADFLVITHAHSDHAGKVPFLVKKGFTGKIIMTDLTKKQCREMWLDYVRLVTAEIEKVKELNSKISGKLHQAVSIVEHVETIKDKKSKTKNAKLSENYLTKILGEKDIEIAFSESLALMKEYGVESESDISSVLNEVPVLLFDEKDIEITLNKITTLEKKEELELKSFHPISSGNDPIILELPKMVKDGYNKPVPVVSLLKGTVISKFQSLIKKIAKENAENERIEIENSELTNRITLAYNFAKWYEENGINKAIFENKYSELLNENEEDLLKKIKLLSEISLNGVNYDLQGLIKIYKSFSFALPENNEVYEKLKEELSKLGINSKKDIEKNLPELPEYDYDIKDVRLALKDIITVGENFSVSDINISNYGIFIDDINKFSSVEILGFINSGKRIYISKSILNELLKKLIYFVDENKENIKNNEALKTSLYNAFDLIEIYEGNRSLYLEQNQREYIKAKKEVSSYKEIYVKETSYSKEDLDDLIDIDFENISKNKTIIQIKKLDDKRLYDILFLKDFNTVYYIDLKIRVRAKEKLTEYILKLEKEKNIAIEKEKKYKKDLRLVRIYEGNEKLNISEEDYNNAKLLLVKYSIKNKNQLNKLNLFNIETQYTQKDVENLFNNSHTVEDDFSLENDTDIIYINNLDDERIYNLPYIYSDFTKVIIIKEELKEDIRKKLIKGIGDYYKTLTIRKNIRNELLEKLELFTSYSENYKYLFNLAGYENTKELLDNLLENNADINSIRSKLKKIKFARELKAKFSEGELQKEQDYLEARELLKQYNINELSDIEKVLKKSHYIPYSISHINRSIELLKTVHIDKNQDILESIKLNFFDAGHIEGSIQAVITLIVSGVDNVLNGGNKNEVENHGKRKLRHTNFGFSGDLGRVKQPNLSGSPENIPFKLDYYQMEATYAGRNHPDKEISINRLLSSIESAQGKVIIPAFSMQRTQEVLMILLKNRLNSQETINKVKELTREIKLKEAELSSILKTTSDIELIELRKNLTREINSLELNINYLKSKIFDFDIVLDSPLSENITKIYIENCGKTYNLLDIKVQKELFGKEVITYVKKAGENEENDSKINFDTLYTEARRNKKEIIISASGMGDGGAIIPHLKENLQNKKSKIIWVGYCPANTRGGKIKALDDFISIDGEPYSLECEVDDIPGFSGHIDEQEIIDYISKANLAKNATITLTHGGELRHELAEKIQTEMDKIGRKVKIVIPKLGDTLQVKI